MADQVISAIPDPYIYVTIYHLASYNYIHMYIANWFT